MDNTVREMVCTKECYGCGYIFVRYTENLNAGLGMEIRKDQQVCPSCRKVTFVVKVEHPGETL